MAARPGRVVVGLDNGGTTNNATVLDLASGQFLVEGLLEVPSSVRSGPDVALDALVEAFGAVLTATGRDPADVAAVGLDSPGPASADGVISSRGSTNFEHPGWHGYDLRSALASRLGLPVVYNNDGNAAALYAHHVHHGPNAPLRSSVTAVVGTGLGAGLVHLGRIVRGAAGMAGELGHVRLPLDGLLEPGQPVPACNCGRTGDGESFASLTGIAKNLLPYWLTRYPGHELAELPPAAAARAVRRLGEAGDELARHVFEQQAAALGRLFTVVADVFDPDTYFVGGGVVEAEPEFRTWFLDRVQAHTQLRDEQQEVAGFVLVPHLDTAGARGSALAAAAGSPLGQGGDAVPAGASYPGAAGAPPSPGAWEGRP